MYTNHTAFIHIILNILFTIYTFTNQPAFKDQKDTLQKIKPHPKTKNAQKTIQNTLIMQSKQSAQQPNSLPSHHLLRKFITH